MFCSSSRYLASICARRAFCPPLAYPAKGCVSDDRWVEGRRTDHAIETDGQRLSAGDGLSLGCAMREAAYQTRHSFHRCVRWSPEDVVRQGRERGGSDLSCPLSDISIGCRSQVEVVKYCQSLRVLNTPCHDSHHEHLHTHERDLKYTTCLMVITAPKIVSVTTTATTTY